MRRGRWVLAGVLLVALAVVAVGAIIFASAKASLTSDSQAIAKIGMPLGGGTIEKVTMVTGPHATPIPVKVSGDRIYPTHPISADEKVSLQVVVKRPGWMSWFAGSQQRLNLALTTPAASLRSHYITVAHNAALKLHFKKPGVEVFSYGTAGNLKRQVLGQRAHRRHRAAHRRSGFDLRLRRPAPLGERQPGAGQLVSRRQFGQRGGQPRSGRPDQAEHGDPPQLLKAHLPGAGLAPPGPDAGQPRPLAHADQPLDRVRPRRLSATASGPR